MVVTLLTTINKRCIICALGVTSDVEIYFIISIKLKILYLTTAGLAVLVLSSSFAHFKKRVHPRRGPDNVSRGSYPLFLPVKVVINRMIIAELSLQLGP